MDVPVDDRDPFGAMRLLCVARGDRGVVEQAEAHRLVAFGVMAGRAGGHEHIVGPAGEDVVNRRVGGADGGQRGFPALRTGRGVGVDPGNAGLGNARAHAVKKLAGMREQHQFGVGRVGLDPLEAGEALVIENLGDGPQPVGALGMAGWRNVFEVDRMAVESRGHAPI